MNSKALRLRESFWNSKTVQRESLFVQDIPTEPAHATLVFECKNFAHLHSADGERSRSRGVVSGAVARSVERFDGRRASCTLRIES